MRPTRSANPDGPKAASGTAIAAVAHVLLYAAHALMFRFAEYVARLGGDERDAGRVVGVALCLALLVRPLIGRGIDRFGVRAPWLGCTAVFVAGNLALLATDSLSLGLYAARALFTVGFTGMLACAMEHGPRAGRPRLVAIGGLESCVFFGLLLGSLGGWLLFHGPLAALRFRALIGATLGIGLVYFLLVAYASPHRTGTRAVDAPTAFRALRVWPAEVILAALVIGLNFAVTTVFLTRYFTHLRIAGGVEIFFVAYCLFSLAIQGWLRSGGVGRSDGRRRLVLGLCAIALGQLSFPMVTTSASILLPAFACALGRALLYPAVVALGAEALPVERRGSGTSLILGLIDLGLMLSAPLLGVLIDGGGWRLAFLVTGCAVAGVAVFVHRRSERSLGDGRLSSFELSR